MAEDADLTMNLLEQGYSVIYEGPGAGLYRGTSGYGWPDAAAVSLVVRDIAGDLQASRARLPKHRAMGLFALPNILIFQILLPLVSPLIDLMFVFGVVHYFIDKYFHPEAASTASFYKLLAFFLAFLIIDFIASALAFALEKKHPARQGRWVAAVPYMDSAVHVPASLFGGAVQDGEAGDRRQAIQLGTSWSVRRRCLRLRRS